LHGVVRPLSLKTDIIKKRYGYGYGLNHVVTFICDLQESSFWGSKQQQQQQQFTESNKWPPQNRFFYDPASLSIWIGCDWLDERYAP
jgi:hypothetical protein